MKKKANSFYTISSKKFKSINSALAQMIKWDKAGTLDKDATIYEVVAVVRVNTKLKKLKKKKELSFDF
jgi:hypothetical protein